MISNRLKVYKYGLKDGRSFYKESYRDLFTVQAEIIKRYGMENFKYCFLISDDGSTVHDLIAMGIIRKGR